MKEFEIANEAHKILSFLHSRGIRARHEEWTIELDPTKDKSLTDATRLKDKLNELISPFQRDIGFDIQVTGSTDYDKYLIGTVNHWTLTMTAYISTNSIHIVLDRFRLEGVDVHYLIKQLTEAADEVESAMKKYTAAMTDDIEPYLHDRVEEITLRAKYSIGDAQAAAKTEAEELNEFLETLNWLAIIDNANEILEHSSWEDHYNGGYIADLAGPRFSDFYDIATG